MKKKLNNFRASLEFTEGVLTQKVENVAKPLDTIEEKVQKVYDYHQDADYIQDKLRGHSVITLPQNAQNVDPTPPSLFALVQLWYFDKTNENSDNYYKKLKD